MWQWGGLKQTTSPCDEKISLPPHDRHKDMSRCYFKGKGFGGEEGSRRDSSTPNQGSKPWIMEKRGPKSEITEPISEPPPGSHRSVTLLMPLQAPPEGREHFNRTRHVQSVPASPHPSRNGSRIGWHSPLSFVLARGKMMECREWNCHHFTAFGSSIKHIGGEEG